MSIVLEIGPGETFLFDTPGGTTTNKVPEGLKDLEAGVGVGKPIQAIYSLNFGWGGAYFLGALTANGPIIRRHNLPLQLESWLIDPTTHTCKREIPTLAVELGPDRSFFARDKDSYRWHNLPDALEEAIQQRLCPAGWTARPDLVVLGADGAFIYANDRGGHCYALANYPQLQQLVINLQSTNEGGLTGFGLIHWVSMSIYQPGHFIALQNSGQHVAELFSNPLQALNSMAGTFPIRNTAPPPIVVSQPPPYSAQPLNSRFNRRSHSSRSSGGDSRGYWGLHDYATRDGGSYGGDSGVGGGSSFGGDSGGSSSMGGGSSSGGGGSSSTGGGGC